MYKVYKFFDGNKIIHRETDSASIPFDDRNADYQMYIKWTEGYDVTSSGLEKVSGPRVAAELNYPEDLL